MADKLHIFPIVPPPTKRQQKRFDLIRRAVKLMRLHEPRLDEADIYNAWIDAANQIRDIRQEIADDLKSLKGKELKLSQEDGSELALLVISYYHLRALAYAKTRTWKGATQGEASYLSAMVGILKPKPGLVNTAALMMELNWDLLSVPIPLGPLGATDDEALTLAMWLYTQSAHPNFDVPDSLKS